MAKEMSGQFSSRQEAIDHANKHFRAKFGDDIMFPDGDKGRPARNTLLSEAWSFQVVDPLGEELGHYNVRCISNEVFWLGISYRVKPIPSEALIYPRPERATTEELTVRAFKASSCPYNSIIHESGRCIHA